MSAPRTAPPCVPAAHAWRRVPLAGLGVGLAGLAASAALGWGGAQLASSYLLAFTFCATIALGALFFLLTQLVGGAVWSVVLRRLVEGLSGALPLFALLFVPLALHARALYGGSATQHAGDFSLAGFAIRSAACLLIWAALGGFFGVLAARQDRGDGALIARRLRRAAAPALALFVLSTSLASFEWLTPLAPGWRSTIFGLYFLVGAAGAGLAAITLLALLARRAGLLAPHVNGAHLADLGSYLFAFTALWAYVAFAQYLIVWYGNLPEETIWYARRTAGGWAWVSALLVGARFVVPFAGLLLRGVKRGPARLGLAAAWLLGAHGVDLYWIIVPALHPTGPRLTLLDGTALLGVGGLFCAVVGRLLCARPLVPHNDPALPAALAHGGARAATPPAPSEPPAAAEVSR